MLVSGLNLTVLFLNYKPLTLQASKGAFSRSCCCYGNLLCYGKDNNVFTNNWTSDKEWLQCPIEIIVLETVLSHLKAGVHVRAVLTWLNTAFCQYLGHVSSDANSLS